MGTRGEWLAPGEACGDQGGSSVFQDGFGRRGDSNISTGALEQTEKSALWPEQMQKKKFIFGVCFSLK